MVAAPAHMPTTLQRYLSVTQVERDWVLSGAVRYLRDLELERKPEERVTANERERTTELLRRFDEHRFRSRLDRCLLSLLGSDKPEVNLERARSLRLGGSEGLLCLAALQFAYTLQCRCRRLARQEIWPEAELWEAFVQLMEFCHTKAYKLVATYEEHRQLVQPKRPRGPAESYAEWRARSPVKVVELHPISIEFVRQEGDAPPLREERTGFQRRWIEKQVADAWQFQSQPYQ